MKDKLLNMYEQEGTKKILASLISIFVGLAVGAIVVVIVHSARLIRVRHMYQFDPTENLL